MHSASLPYFTKFAPLQLVEESQKVMNTKALRDQNEEEERQRQEAVIQRKRQQRQEKLRREGNSAAAPDRQSTRT